MAIRTLGKNKYQLIVDYYDEEGKRRKHTKVVTCNGKRAAKELLEQFAESWSDALPEDVTVSDLVQDYIDSREVKGAKATTIKSYKSIKKKFNEDIGMRPARSLTTYQIERYIVQWVKNDKLSAKTIKNMVSLLRSSYKMAIRSGLLSENPCDNVELPKIRKPDIKTFSSEEILLFIDLLKQKSLDFRVLCELALFCGLRRGEILGLTKDDIDFENGVIRVRKVRYLVDGETIVEEPKTERSRRNLSCPAFVLEDIKQLFAEHEQMTDCEYLIQYVGEPIAPDYASWQVRSFIDSLDQLPHVTLHGLRHTFATMLNASGDFDLADISAALGHTTISTTMNIYVNVFDGASKSSKRISDSMDKKYGRHGSEA